MIDFDLTDPKVRDLDFKEQHVRDNAVTLHNGTLKVGPLRKEVIVWLHVNIVKGWLFVARETDHILRPEIKICFNDLDEAALFRLRWL